MNLTGKQKKYIKKNLRKKQLEKIANDLNISKKEILAFLKSSWRKEKYQKFISSQQKLASFNFKSWFIKNRLSLACLSLLVIITYINSIQNNFVSDDISGILKNRQLSKIKYVFANRFSFFYTLIHYLIANIFGRSPAAFRIFNILSHLGSTLSLYFLVFLISGPSIALFSSLLFAVHPILTESVTWISGGYYSYSAFLILLSFSSYILSSKKKSQKYYFVSVFLYFLALSTSEKVLAFPIVLSFYEFTFGKLKTNWKKLVPFVALSGFWTFYLLKGFGTRVAILQNKFYQQPKQINNHLQLITTFIRQAPIAITSYLQLIFWPKNLTLYHSEMSFTITEYLFRLCFFASFLIITLYAFKKNRPLFFWLSFFIICLSPTLTPLGVSWVVAERYVYLGSAGIFVAFSFGIKKLMEIEKLRTPIIALFVLIIISLSIRTIIRNKDWQNQDTLWLATAKTSPSSPQNHNNLGDLFARHGQFKKSIAEFKKAIALKPNYGDAYHNLANIYHQTKKDNLAIQNYQKALSFNPNLWQSHQNLAAIFFRRKNYQLSLQHLLAAIKINPQNSELYTNLGLVYFKLNKKEKAQEALQKAIQLDPKNIKAQQALSSLLRRENENKPKQSTK